MEGMERDRKEKKCVTHSIQDLKDLN